MKALQFGKFFPPDMGGIESFIFDLTEELSQKIKCDVLCSNSKNKTVIEKKKKLYNNKNSQFWQSIFYLYLTRYDLLVKKDRE